MCDEVQFNRALPLLYPKKRSTAGNTSEMEKGEAVVPAAHANNGPENGAVIDVVNLISDDSTCSSEMVNKDAETAAKKEKGEN